MRKYNRYTRMNGKPNFYRFRVCKARFNSDCQCGKQIVAGSNIAWAKNWPAICMECFCAWEFDVLQENAVEHYNQQLMGGGW